MENLKQKTAEQYIICEGRCPMGSPVSRRTLLQSLFSSQVSGRKQTDSAGQELGSPMSWVGLGWFGNNRNISLRKISVDVNEAHSMANFYHIKLSLLNFCVTVRPITEVTHSGNLAISHTIER